MKAQDLLVNPKLQATVVGSTATTGTATMMEWLPSHLGIAATVLGIASTVIIIYFSISKGRLEREKLELELKIIREMEEERKADRRHGRRKTDLPCTSLEETIQRGRPKQESKSI